MWVAAALCLAHQDIPEFLPSGFEEFGMDRFFDQQDPYPPSGQEHAEAVITKLSENLSEARRLWI